MKRSSFLFLLISALAAGGCIDPLEKRRTQEVQAQLERGVTGQGQLGGIDRSSDPYVKPRDAGSNE